MAGINPTGTQTVFPQKEAENRNISIASVTVAYNGAGVLARHLEALKRQTRELDDMIVVNNASTDDTLILLAAQYPEVTVLNLPNNTGVGGGLAAGIEYAAIQQKYDWVWAFDQDSTPAGDALQQLLSGLKQLASPANVAILAPVNIHPETQMTCPGLSWRGKRLVPTPEPTEHVTFVDSVITSGSLIRREAVEAVGLPRSDFFIDFVDHEHCLRLRRHGFKIALIRDSVLYHVHGDPTTISFLGRTKYWTDHVPWREYYMTRNEIFTIWQYYPHWTTKAFTLYRLGRHALDVLLFGKRKLECFKMMYRGLFDGRAGNLDYRIPASPR